MSTKKCNMFRFRTHRQMDYLEALNGIPTFVIDKWWGMEFVSQGLLVWRKAQVRMEFIYTEKSKFSDECNEKRCWRSRLGARDTEQCSPRFLRT